MDRAVSRVGQGLCPCLSPSFALALSSRPVLAFSQESACLGMTFYPLTGIGRGRTPALHDVPIDICKVRVYSVPQIYGSDVKEAQIPLDIKNQFR